MKSPFSTKVRYLVFNEDVAYPICHLLVRQYYTIVAERKEAVMDAIVSARVPIALKERGNGILHDIGSTPTQLINAAYQFVLAEHELPKPHDPLEGMRGAKRELTRRAEREGAPLPQGHVRRAVRHRRAILTSTQRRKG